MSDHEVSEDEILAAVGAIIANNTIGVVQLDSHKFDRLPCTRRRLYSILRRRTPAGWTYQKGEYVASGNRPFAKKATRGYRLPPSLVRNDVAARSEKRRLDRQS